LVDPAAPEATGMMCKTFTNDDDYTTFRRPEEYGACWEFVVKAQDILSLVPFQPSEVSHAE
jgi:hypothetical protein